MKKARKAITLLLVFVVITLFTASSFASGGYGNPKTNQTSNYFTWMVADDVPRWVGATCGTTYTQYAEIYPPYISFHESYLFAYAYPTSPYDEYQVWGGYNSQYYKGSTYLGSATLSTCYDPVAVDPDWVWFYKSGNANSLLGSGSSTYYAKTTASFSVVGSIDTYTVQNSISFTY